MVGEQKEKKENQEQEQKKKEENKEEKKNGGEPVRACRNCGEISQDQIEWRCRDCPREMCQACANLSPLCRPCTVEMVWVLWARIQSFV